MEKARLQEFQERFLAILGHDLRNPLASIDMGIGILQQKVTESMLTGVDNTIENDLMLSVGLNFKTELFGG